MTQGKVKEGGKRGWGGGGPGESGAEIDFTCFPLSHVSPPNQQQPPLRRASPLCFGGRGETTDFLPVPSVCFSKTPVHARPLAGAACFALPEASERFWPGRTLSLYSHIRFSLCLRPVADAQRVAAGPQPPAVGHPLLEQPEPRRAPEPRQAAGPQLPLPGRNGQQVRKSSSGWEAGGGRKEVVRDGSASVKIDLYQSVRSLVKV